MFFLLLAVILSELHENLEGNIELQKKEHRRKMIYRFKLNMYAFFIKSPTFSPAF